MNGRENPTEEGESPILFTFKNGRKAGFCQIAEGEKVKRREEREPYL